MQWFFPIVHPATCFRRPAEFGPLNAHVEQFIRRGLRGNKQPPTLLANPPVAALRELIECVRAARVCLAIDVETKGKYGRLPGFAQLRAVGVGAALKDGVGLSWSWPPPPDVLKELHRVFADRSIPKVLCNGFHFDLPILRRHHLLVRCNIHDIRDGRRALVSTSKVGLGPQASYYLVCGPWKADIDHEEDDEKGTPGENVPEEKLLRYNAEDCVRTAQIRVHQSYELHRESPDDAARRGQLYRQHLRTARVAAWMHLQGFPVDGRRRKALSNELLRLSEQRRRMVDKLTQKRGKLRFGPGGVNEEDLRALIYREAGRPSIRSFGIEVPFGEVCRTETGKPAVNKDALLYLFSLPSTPEPLREIIRVCWQVDAPLKARNTYVDSPKVLAAIGPAGRIHPGHNSVGTETGRWSCKAPNLYNLSEEIKEEEGDLRGDLPDVRSMYVAPRGFVIVHGDFKQLELEIMADVTGDVSLRRMCDSGDPHTARVQEWFGIPSNSPVPKVLRRQGKVVGYACQYGAGIRTVFLAVLEKDQNAHFDEISALHSQFPERHPGINAWWGKSLEEAESKGYNESAIMHRRIYYPLGVRPPEVTQTANYRIQSTAADIFNVTLVGDGSDRSSASQDLGEGRGLADILVRSFPKSWLACGTYDSFDVICPKREAKDVADVMREHMRGPWLIGASPRALKADIKVGERWSDV